VWEVQEGEALLGVAERSEASQYQSIIFSSMRRGDTAARLAASGARGGVRRSRRSPTWF